MSGKRYRLTPLAEADLEDIWLYTFKTWSQPQADRYVGALIAAFSDLAAGRSPGRPVEVIAGYSKQLVGSHMIYFRRDATGMVVVRILHARMDAERHL